MLPLAPFRSPGSSAVDCAARWADPLRSHARIAARAHGRGSRRSHWEDVLIPGSFEYHRPANLSEAIALLGQLDSDARVIAGGHSLIPMMKLRLAMPSHLIDLAGIAELKGVRLDGGEIVIGAMTTQHEIIASELLAQHCPDPARDGRSDRRSAGALRRHDRRQCRQRRSGQRHAGADDDARRGLRLAEARAASAALPRATITSRPTKPPPSPARSSPPSASRAPGGSRLGV